jgi:hypothetical protein
MLIQFTEQFLKLHRGAGLRTSRFCVIARARVAPWGHAKRAICPENAGRNGRDVECVTWRNVTGEPRNYAVKSFASHPRNGRLGPSKRGRRIREAVVNRILELHPDAVLNYPWSCDCGGDGRGDADVEHRVGLRRSGGNGAWQGRRRRSGACKAGPGRAGSTGALGLGSVSHLRRFLGPARAVCLSRAAGFRGSVRLRWFRGSGSLAGLCGLPSRWVVPFGCAVCLSGASWCRPARRPPPVAIALGRRSRRVRAVAPSVGPRARPAGARAAPWPPKLRDMSDESCGS